MLRIGLDKIAHETIDNSLRTSYISWRDDAADPTPAPVRRGVWYKYPANGIKCSECGLFGYVDDGYEYVYNFCPRCGADMREVEKNG